MVVAQKKLFQLTDAAAQKAKELLASRSAPTVGIHVGVKAGGCSGLKYQFEYAEKIEPYQEVVEDKGITIVIDSNAILYLAGTILDFVDERVKSGFVFKNPNEKAGCGCGESFSA